MFLLCLGQGELKCHERPHKFIKLQGFEVMDFFNSRDLHFESGTQSSQSFPNKIFVGHGFPKRVGFIGKVSDANVEFSNRFILKHSKSFKIGCEVLKLLLTDLCGTLIRNRKDFPGLFGNSACIYQPENICIDPIKYSI